MVQVNSGDGHSISSQGTMTGLFKDPSTTELTRSINRGKQKDLSVSSPHFIVGNVIVQKRNVNKLEIRISANHLELSFLITLKYLSLVIFLCFM